MIVRDRFIKYSLGVVALVVAFMSYSSTIFPEEQPQRVLVFSKTTGFRHVESIEAGQLAMRKMGEEYGFEVDTTENSTAFTADNLQRYDAVVFLNTSGELFSPQQRISLKRYIQAGGGFLAIHASTDAERDWLWYGSLIGGYFDSHPPIQKATFKTNREKLPDFEFLPDTFERTDEFYNFQQLNPDIKPLVSIDERSYVGGNMGAKHPMVWYHEFDGGRSFYTAMGHTKESYAEPLFLKMVWTGLHWVMGGDHPEPLDFSVAMPEENRFVKNELLTKLDEPMQMAIADNSQVYFAERRGRIKWYDPATKQDKIIGTVPVNSKYEDGLLGLTLDPEFKENRWLYVFYTIPNGLNFQLSRFTLNGEGLLDDASEKTLLRIPKQILDGSHTGGALLFDPRGTGDLYITVGDNSSPRKWRYAPIDERPDRLVWDAQRSSANTNDLRGKILRIHPESNGTYSVPEGNLFPKGTPKTRPEIYSMGHRQPWRISIDSKTGWLYLGEVGPDAKEDSVGLGPAGQDEFNQIREPGNYGWPYFVGDSKAYWDYDFSTGESGNKYNVGKPVNNSPNNTGLTELPAARDALIWYPYKTSEKFPLMGTGGRSATGGPVFRKGDFKNAEKVFPDYYEGKWFITDWMRGWIMVVSLDDAGNYKSMEHFLPGEKFANPIDLQFGPDGSLYILEYGTGWFQGNDNARLVRIDYNSGNRKPVVEVSADKFAGSSPLAIQLSSEGSIDYDADELRYTWEITSRAGKVLQRFDEPNPSLTLSDRGEYQATLTIKDSKGAESSKSLEITAGNEPPEISIDITAGNKTFVFPESKISYTVNVSDKEDGSLAAGTIPEEKVTVSVDYQSGIGKSEFSGHQNKGKTSSRAKILMRGSDCYSCHGVDKKSVGPSWKEIADRYKDDKNAFVSLAKKVIEGGSGAWGEVTMSAHPDMKPEDAEEIINYIISLNEPAEAVGEWPVNGDFVAKLSSVDRGKDGYGYVIRASYTDNGTSDVSPLCSEAIVELMAPRLMPTQASISKSVIHMKTVQPIRDITLFTGSFAYLGFPEIDLTGVAEIRLIGKGKNPLEIRLDSPTGLLVGQTELIPESNNSSAGKGEAEYKVMLQGVKGMHDLYLVSRNNTDSRSKRFFTLERIELIPEESVADK